MAKSDPIWQKRSESCSDCKSGKRWSDVILDKPEHHASLYEDTGETPEGNSNGVTRCVVATSSLNGFLGTGGLRSGFPECSMWVRFARRQLCTNACRATDNSPNCANRKAREALEHHEDGTFSHTSHSICAVLQHTPDPRKAIVSIPPLGIDGICFPTVCAGCDLDEDGSTTSLATA